MLHTFFTQIALKERLGTQGRFESALIGYSNDI